MIQKEVIREILLENRKEVELQHVVPRNFQMEDFANYVLIGVRRAGKSFMLYQQIQQNLKRESPGTPCSTSILRMNV